MALSDEDKAYIKEVAKEARQILRDDKILARLPAPDPVKEPQRDPKDGPASPPKKDEPVAPVAKPDRWWGDSVSA
jgi:hypothetical protein